ncbi:MAG: hypothetical protein D6816_16390 [Bacteroidetes bacterium]|nr:MAG: hypothetical protein D6816_16390 [Bacteroidota bacterium]
MNTNAIATYEAWVDDKDGRIRMVKQTARIKSPKRDALRFQSNNYEAARRFAYFMLEATQ